MSLTVSQPIVEEIQDEPGSTGYLMIVDDDPAGRAFLEVALQRAGYEVFVVDCAGAARLALTNSVQRKFDCVITDYRMPEETGLELLAWIKRTDPSLATIIVTAENERGLVTESLRGGAVDFLDKPIVVPNLRVAVQKAVAQTRRQRDLAESKSAIVRMGLAQERMLHNASRRARTQTNVCFHPRHKAGGDFFTKFQPSAHQTFCLLTDVSGHDGHAAYVSAYFHGLVRGMLERQTAVPEIFTSVNRLLLEEWNERKPAHNGAVNASVAACAILLDSKARTATVVCHGMPAPVYWQPCGRSAFVGESGGFPLGWFDDLPSRRVVQETMDGDAFTCWTDGLSDVARARGVSDLSLAFALQEAKARERRLPELDLAEDDILLADIHLSAQAGAEIFCPLLLEQYSGNCAADIDGMQDFWMRSLKMALPEIREDSLHDCLLASRETVLNAVSHGCSRPGLDTVSYQVAYCAARRILRVEVCDPGPGHRFNVEEHERRAWSDLDENHRGLILVKHCASRMRVGRSGASLTMDFDLG